MIVSSIVDLVKINLNEAGLTYYTEDDILEVIQDGYDEIAVLTKCIENYTVYPKINDLVYYDFSIGVPDFYALTGIFNNTTKKWLYPRTIKEARLLRSDWELWEGEPDNFLITSFKLTAIFPTKATAVGSFIIFYNALAPTINLGSQLKFPAKHFNILENYVTGTLLEQAEEFVKASKYLKEYYDAIPKVHSAAKALAASDRLMVMGDSMPRFAESITGDEMWVDHETPTIVNSTTLTIVSLPSPSTAFYLHRDGILLAEGTGFTRSGTTITLSAGYEDYTGCIWRASYRTA
jgi:hypothetical protein